MGKDVKINNIKLIQKELEDKYGEKLKEWRLRQVVKANLDMKFRKVKKIPK